MANDGKKPQKKSNGGRKPHGIRSTDIQAECNTYFKQGEFNISLISEETGHTRETISKYKSVYLTEVRDTTDFITREQDARDELILYLENHIKDSLKEVRKLNKMLPKAGKSLGMLVSIIANLRRDNKETKKEIAGLKMMPLTEDKIEQAILAKYGIKIDELKKKVEGQTPQQQ